jgi:hypothetical protein
MHTKKTKLSASTLACTSTISACCVSPETLSKLEFRLPNRQASNYSDLKFRFCSHAYADSAPIFDVIKAHTGAVSLRQVEQLEPDNHI